MDLKRLISEPYPYYFKGREFLSVMVILFVMSLAFNYLFEPFVVFRPEHKFSFFWICMIHSANAVFVAALLISLINLKVNEDHWTVGKEILLISGVLLAVGVGQFLIRDIIYDNPNNWSWGYFMEEVRNTFLVGTLFVLILVPLNFLRLNYNHSYKARNLEKDQKNDKELSPLEVTIKTQLKADDFSLNPSRLLFAKAEGNYLEFFVDHDQQVIKLLKRLTLKDLETQLEDFPFLVKTHRSYLVNLKKIQHFSGNAQGYKLSFDGYTESVPVSRGMISNFEQSLKSF